MNANHSIVTYIDRHIMSWELPRVEVKPIIRHFDLIAIDYFLFEDTVAVAQTVAPRRKKIDSNAAQLVKAEVILRSEIWLISSYRCALICATLYAWWQQKVVSN